jgi:YggT family protein
LLCTDQARNPPAAQGATPVALCAHLPYLWAIRNAEWPMASLFDALMLILNVIWFVMIAHIILSWLISFQVLNTRQPAVAQIWYGLTRLLEPFYAPIRRFLPQTPGLDLAPLVAFVILLILQRTLSNNVGFFYGQ